MCDIGTGRVYPEELSAKLRKTIPYAQVELRQPSPREARPERVAPLDISRGTKELGYEPKYMVGSALRGYAQWAKSEIAADGRVPRGLANRLKTQREGETGMSRFAVQAIFGVWYGYRTQETISDLVRMARRAERAGVELLPVLTYAYSRETTIPMAAVAMKTRRIKFAPIVIDALTRTPIGLAKEFANLDELSGGRAIIGLGAGGPEVGEMEGIPFVKPLQRVRESVEIIRALLRKSTVDYDGEIFKLRRATVGFRPVRDRIPIYLGGFGPRLLQLAGEVADGIFLASAPPRDYVRQALEQIRKGAEKAGRSLDDIEVLGPVVLSVADTAEKARAVVRPVIATYYSYPGYSHLIPYCSFKEEAKKMGELERAGQHEQAAKLVTDKIVDEVAVAGTPSECRESMERFGDLGLKIHRIIPVGPSPVDAFNSTLRVISRI